MKYQSVVKATFLSRPNRFIAMVRVDGKELACHVKNTGRCRELLVPGAGVYLEEARSPGRKTPYSLIAVQKGKLLINIDSQAPNRAVKEWLEEGGLFPDLTLIQPEKKFGDSRFDFYLDRPGERWFLEVKGVTLEENGTVYFPDAPTQRGVRHVAELRRCLALGYRAAVLFVIQLEGALCFSPNRATHAAFADELALAQKEGVSLLAWDCRITPDSMTLNAPVPIRLV